MKLSILLLPLIYGVQVSGQIPLPTTQVIRENILNSPALETNIALTANRLTIYFSSRRGGQWWSQDDSDIFYSIRLDSLGSWSPPLPLNPPINDELNQDEVHISPDGNLLTYQRWSNDWREEGGPYYQSAFSGNRDWKNTQPLGGGITDFFDQTSNKATDGMTRMPDGSVIFAAGPDFDQPMDLFYSKFDGPLGFLFPVPLSCNTDYDERSVFLSADGRSLYFASNRPSGSGGLDIYRIVFREDGSLGMVENVGSPINSEKDDYGLVIHCSDEGFFIRDGDIFRVINPNLRFAPVAPVENAPPPLDIIDTSNSNNVNLSPAPPYPDLQSKPDTTSMWQVVSPPPVKVNAPPSPLVIPPPEDIGIYTPNNIVFLLDISNSMGQEDKLPLMIRAIRQSLKYFYRQDRISVITFAEKPSIILNGAEGDQRKMISGCFTGMKTGGQTQGKPALEKAIEFAEKHFIQDGQNIVVWATDANLNFSNLRSHAKEMKRKGIQLIMLIYGNNRSEIERDVTNYLEIAGGRHIWVRSNNVVQALEEILHLEDRKN